MPTLATADPGALRPMLQTKIAQMSDQEVVLLHQVLLKLEARRLWEEIKDEGMKDRAAGKFEQLDDVIKQVRSDLASR